MTSADKFEEVKNRPASIIFLSTPSCGPCKLLTRVFESWPGTVADIEEINKFDATELPEFCEQENVTAVPVIIFYVGGHLIHRNNGIIKNIEKYFDELNELYKALQEQKEEVSFSRLEL